MLHVDVALLFGDFHLALSASQCYHMHFRADSDITLVLYEYLFLLTALSFGFLHWKGPN